MEASNIGVFVTEKESTVRSGGEAGAGGSDVTGEVIFGLTTGTETEELAEEEEGEDDDEDDGAMRDT